METRRTLKNCSEPRNADEGYLIERRFGELIQCSRDIVLKVQRTTWKGQKVGHSVIFESTG